MPMTSNHHHGQLRLPTRTVQVSATSMPSSSANSRGQQLSPGDGDNPLSIDQSSSNDILLKQMAAVFASSRQQQQINGTNIGWPNVAAPPLLMRKDMGETTSDLVYTELEGIELAGFIVGGERRLCVPQMIALVLHSAELEDINWAYKLFNVHVSHCSKEQLMVLKAAGALPMSADGSTLITKTDAERITNYLLYPASDKINEQQNSTRSDTQVNSNNNNKNNVLRIRHGCFGGAKGLLHIGAYTSPKSECVECARCHRLFTNAKFVLHTHKSGAESRTCHWGFDSANWRSYIHLQRAYAEDSEANRLMTEIKNRYSSVSTTQVNSNVLRLSRVGGKRTSDMAKLNNVKGESDEAAYNAILSNDYNSGKSRPTLSIGAVGLAPFVPTASHPDMARYYELMTTYYQLLQHRQQQQLPSTVDVVVSQQQALLASIIEQQQISRLPSTINDKCGSIADKNCGSVGGDAVAAANSTAEAAAGLLALSSALAIDPTNIDEKSLTKAKDLDCHHRLPIIPLASNDAIPTKFGVSPRCSFEPFKKHLLHQFEVEQRLGGKAANETLDEPLAKVYRKNGATTEEAMLAAEFDSNTSLDSLLAKFVTDEPALAAIRAKIASSQQLMLKSIDALQNENQLLKKELTILQGATFGIGVEQPIGRQHLLFGH